MGRLPEVSVPEDRADVSFNALRLLVVGLSRRRVYGNPFEGLMLSGSSAFRSFGRVAFLCYHFIVLGFSSFVL